MSLIVTSLVYFIALLHIYFLVLEMFLWDKPSGLRAFGHSLQQAQKTKVLAANQGLYNGFLAAGLVYSSMSNQLNFVIFFLGCVVIAGIYGAYSANKKILFIQALPAAVTLVLMAI